MARALTGLCSSPWGFWGDILPRSDAFVSFAPRLCGFLLTDAVEGTETPDEIAGVNADDFTAGEL